MYHVGTLERGLENPSSMKHKLSKSDHCRWRKVNKCDFLPKIGQMTFTKYVISLKGRKYRERHLI